MIEPAVLELLIESRTYIKENKKSHLNNYQELNLINKLDAVIEAEVNGVMRIFGDRNYALVVQGVKTEGTYDPNEIFYIFEEQLYVHESSTIFNFLEWVHEDTPNRAFGHGNYEERFQTFLNK
jgi:hypothetical protein